MKHAATSALSVFLIACALGSADTPKDLVGRWSLVNEPAPGCTRVSFEFTADGHLKITSGAQVLEATIQVTSEQGGFLISEKLLRHNNEPNCQGKSATYVVEHFAPFMFVRVCGAQLSVTILDEDRKQHGQPGEFRRDGV